MKKCILVFLFVIIVQKTINAQLYTLDSMFQALDEHIDKRNEYEAVKNASINKLIESLENARGEKNTSLLFFLHSELTKEYAGYNYDSAVINATRALSLAYRLNARDKIAVSKSMLGHILTKRGLYREAIDTLLSVDSEELNTEDRIQYFGYSATAYYNIADYNFDLIFSPSYRRIAERYIDSIIQISIKDNPYRLYYRGLFYLARYDLDNAVGYYEKILEKEDITIQLRANVHSALGYIYREYYQKDKSKIHTIQSAIYDLINSTKETMALSSLAEQLYYERDIDHAYKYVLIAKEDVDFYGAKLRQLFISTLLPKIEAEKLNMIEKKRRQLLHSTLLLSSVALVILTLAFLILMQFTKLRKAKKLIQNRNNDLEDITFKLQEANKIKTEYVGYYFSFSTQYIDKLEGLKKVITSLLATKNLDGIERSISSIEPKKEREKLFENFDRYFLRIFPEFVQKFNDLLEPDARISFNDNHTLNNDLRIFALIRLGIRDNEQIARILNFSVNTVYTYKNKIKKKAIVPNAEFDDKIMEIKSV
jgi:tetratricopeptide (TPR) repeat protein